jgi:predicted dehydrogenase
MGFHDADRARADKVASELGVASFSSLEALLDVVDAVSVVVPTPAHYAVAAPALERGLHVLIEKPIATTLEEADGLLAIARRNGAVVQTGHVERFNRAVRAALPFVDSPRFIESNRLAPFNPRGSDVAVVLDLMIHDIDLVRTFVGGGVRSVSAVGVPVLTPFVDIANARLSFEAGAVANITASRVSRERLRKLRIFQQTGYLSLDLGAGTVECYRLRKDVDFGALVRDAQGAQALESFVERVAVEAPEGEPLRLELEAFVQAVAGEAPIAVTGEDGREALAVALTIVQDIERTFPSLSGAIPAHSGV